MSTPFKMFAPLPSSHLLRQSMGRLFGSCIHETRKKADLPIEEAARLSGMEVSEWMAIEEGCVPQDINRLRAMADAMQISFDQIATLVLVCRAAWEL
ncbi:MAG: helix-turn-helix domain-containing protein [Terracidiphilus sp.]|jgi:transcriptional regulator with XRE-family HTH domain